MRRVTLVVLLFASLLFAQKRAAVTTVRPGSSPSADARIRAAQESSSCPNQGGLLTSISLPVGQPLELEVFISETSDINEPFDVSVDNPAIANAGDPTQGFLGTVTVPAGSQLSNPFTVIGGAIGQANLVIESETGDYGTSETPIGPWDVNPYSDAFPFVDANPPSSSCLVSGTANFSTDPNVLANCGAPVYGLASDGVTQLLMRTAAGIPGTMCYEITSTSSLDQGSISDEVLSTEPGPNSYQYGFSYYTGPSFYGDSSDSRDVDVLFTFTPSEGNGNTTTLPGTLTIVRPPVMLLHGLWANASSWNSNYNRNDAAHTTYPGNYSLAPYSNAASFSVNEPYVDTAVQLVLNQFRQKQFAATQADVIAHSMGGLLTRLYVGSNSFQQPGNYNMGDIHRLVTLDTPHIGSSFANLLVDLYQDNSARTVSMVPSLTEGQGTIFGGAVCDLAENSPALEALSDGTDLQSQVITATGGPAGTPATPALYWGGVTSLGINSFESALTEQYCTDWTVGPEGEPICLKSAYYFTQTTVDAFRFRQMNDAVVGLSSEKGGLAGVNFMAYIHFHIPAIPFVQRGITDGDDVTTEVFSILDGPDSGLSSSLPGVLSNGSGAPRTVPGLGAPSDSKTYTAECSPGAPLKPAASQNALQQGIQRHAQRGGRSSLVTLASPAAGTVFSEGNTINIVVSLSPPLTNMNTVGATLSGLMHVTATWTSGLNFSASFTVPTGITGPITITPDYTDTSGNFFTGAPVVVGTKPAGAPQSIALAQSNFVLAPGSPSQQLVLSGTYSDGAVLDLTSVFTGTSYQSNNNKVAEVMGDGVLKVAGPGVAVITVKNSSLTVFATVLVQNPASPLPPQVVTSQFNIQQSGFRLNRTTGFFTETVALTNTSAVPVLGPLNFVVSGLPAGVTLEHATGMSRNFSPGSPYLSVPLSSDGVTFALDQTVTLTLQFLDPKRVNISYTPAVVGVAAVP